jgi:tRNA G10  N-methylase Trm11
MVNTGIIPTTASLSILFGSVAHAIAENTNKVLGAPSTVYAPTRFLYQSKASRSERNAGTEQNHHPTVKPVALMRWLVQMVAPPGGILLDPFAGSGTTGVAAARLGVPCILIEQDEEYCEIAARRIDHALRQREDEQNQPGTLPMPLDLVAD